MLWIKGVCLDLSAISILPFRATSTLTGSGQQSKGDSGGGEKDSFSAHTVFCHRAKLVLAVSLLAMNKL